MNPQELENYRKQEEKWFIDHMPNPTEEQARWFAMQKAMEKMAAALTNPNSQPSPQQHQMQPANPQQHQMQPANPQQHQMQPASTTTTTCGGVQQQQSSPSQISSPQQNQASVTSDPQSSNAQNHDNDKEKRKHVKHNPWRKMVEVPPPTSEPTDGSSSSSSSSSASGTTKKPKRRCQDKAAIGWLLGPRHTSLFTAMFWGNNKVCFGYVFNFHFFFLIFDKKHSVKQVQFSRDWWLILFLQQIWWISHSSGQILFKDPQPI